MKKLFLLSAVTLLSFTAVVAQENAVKVNPLAFFGGSDLVSYEHKLSDHGSAIIGAGFASFKIGGMKYTNIGGELQYRYYFNEAIEGWYAGAQAGFNSGKVVIETASFFGSPAKTDETKYTGFKVGAKAGYQWAWDSGFLLDLNLGFAYNNFNYSDKNGTFSGLKGSTILPNLGFALGYAF
jgi:hypothetical protein